MSLWKQGPMALDDIDQILDIEHALFSTPWSRLSFINELWHEDAAAIVVRRFDPVSGDTRSPILGYAVARRIVDELQILKLGVAEANQRQGIAQLLLQTCVNSPVSEGTVAVFLEVRENNLPAINLYRKAGFRLIGNRRGYYSDTNEDALMMMKYHKENNHEH